MKRILFAGATLAAVLFAAQPSKAIDVSVDFFYNNMSGGSWMEVSDYGYVWQPDVAVSDSAWRPYADGYWAYTDLGWTWVSYEDFGWACYHYGRWARLADYGWVWVPGRDEDLEWGPAWVSWRTGGEYIGWAPLPPETIGIYRRGPYTGVIDIEFNIGPVCYNFVDVRFIGEPVLRERIVDYRQNVTYINQTVNITNITYKNKIVYNYGPDINVINTRASRPIQRLKIERQENVDVSAAAKSGGLMKPQGDKLIVSAPLHIKRAGKEVAPQQVKTKIAKANLDRGWSVVGDEKAQNDLKQQLKTQQGRKAEILSKTGANVNANAQGGASPGAEAGASAAVEEKGKGRGRNRGAEKFEKQNAAAGTNANASPGMTASPNEPAVGTGERGRRKGRNAEQFNANNPPAGGTETKAGASVAPEDQTRGGGRRARRLEERGAQGPQGATGEPLNSPNEGAGANANTSVDQNERGRRGRRIERQGVQGTQGATGEPLNSPNENAGANTNTSVDQGERGRRGRRIEKQGVQGPQGPTGQQSIQPSGTAEPTGNPSNQLGQGAQHRGERVNRPEGVGKGKGQVDGPTGAQGPQGQAMSPEQGQSQVQGQGRHEGKGKNKPEASPSITP